MLAENLPRTSIDTFAHYFRLVKRGETGRIFSTQIEPVEPATDLMTLSAHRETGERALSRLVVVKLNGGLGTSMGMTRAKSLLPVKNNLSFLDIAVRQVLHMREDSGTDFPLVFMNSFHTRDDTLKALSIYPELAFEGIGLDFVQHKVPRIRVDTLSPIEWPDNRELEWCPPGHGNLYAALSTSGMLDKLLRAGFVYAFLSNSDFLGAVADTSILGWIVSQQIPFAMEVTARTAEDTKGGHLAQLNSGAFVLREFAQCAPGDLDDFQNLEKYGYFNTNNLWLNLKSLARSLSSSRNVFPLPMIRNEKNVVASDESSPRVYQTETAMGAAISLFDGARLLAVPRDRFVPVKTTDDLLKLWSDLYTLTEIYHLQPAASGGAKVEVDLDPRFYRSINDFAARFPDGAPSLLDAQSIKVEGDVKFEGGVVVTGNALIENRTSTQLIVERGSCVS